jgi:hypothetical protein
MSVEPFELAGREELLLLDALSDFETSDATGICWKI